MESTTPLPNIMTSTNLSSVENHGSSILSYTSMEQTSSAINPTNVLEKQHLSDEIDFCKNQLFTT